MSVWLTDATDIIVKYFVHGHCIYFVIIEVDIFNHWHECFGQVGNILNLAFSDVKGFKGFKVQDWEHAFAQLAFIQSEFLQRI